MENKSVVGTAVSIAVSIGLLYLTVFYVGKAWKKSQK
jgi:hypothetical protein